MNVKEQAKQIAKAKEVLSAEILFARDEINSWPKFAVSNRKVQLAAPAEETGKDETSSRIESLLHHSQPRLSEMYSPLHQKKSEASNAREELDQKLHFPSMQARKADYINERTSFHQDLVLGERPTIALLRIFHGHIGAVTSISILDFDAKEHLFTGSNDTTCRMYDTTTGACLRIFEGHRGTVNSVHSKVLPGFYHEERESRDAPERTAQTWNDDRLDLLTFALDPKPKIMTLRVFSRNPKGTRLQARLDVPILPGARRSHTRTAERYTLPLIHARVDRRCLPSCVAAPQHDCELQFEEEWQPARGASEATLTLLLKQLLRFAAPGGSTGTFVSVTVDDADLPRLASGSGDRTARLWDAMTGDVVRTFRGHTAEVMQVRFQLGDPLRGGGGERAWGSPSQYVNRPRSI